MIRSLSLCLLLAVCWFHVSPVAAQTAKPENPKKLHLELLIVTCRAEGATAKDDAKLVAKVEDVVKKHESQPLSSLQDAVKDVLPESGEKVAADVDAFSLQTFHDLEQWVKFGTANPRTLAPYFRGNVPSRLLRGETEVKATPWILDEERFGIGVTVERQLPTNVTPQRSTSAEGLVMETLSFTSNTLVNANEAAVINSYRHNDEKLGLVMIVIARVSR